VNVFLLRPCIFCLIRTFHTRINFALLELQNQGIFHVLLRLNKLDFHVNFKSVHANDSHFESRLLQKEINMFEEISADYNKSYSSLQMQV
jgi:hypothetical protein